MSIATIDNKSPWEKATATGGAPQVYKAVIAMKRHIGAIGKNGTADMRNGPKYDFRKFDDVLDAVAPLMNEFGLLLVPVVLSKEERQDGNKHYVILTMSYRVYAEDGSYIEGSSVGESFDMGDKAATKAQTVALRIFYCSTFNIPYTEMKDPEAGENHSWTHKQQGAASRLSAALDSLQDPSKLNGIMIRSIKLHAGEIPGESLTTDELKASIPMFTAAARRLRFTEQVIKDRIEKPLNDAVNGIKNEPTENLDVEPVKLKELKLDFSIAKPEAFDRLVMTAVQSFRAGHVTRAELSELCAEHCPEDLSRGIAVAYLGQIERCDTPEQLSQCVTEVSSAMQGGKIGRDVGKALTNLGQALIDKMKKDGAES